MLLPVVSINVYVLFLLVPLCSYTPTTTVSTTAVTTQITTVTPSTTTVTPSTTTVTPSTTTVSPPLTTTPASPNVRFSF